MATLQTGSPLPLALLWKQKRYDAYGDEKMLHRHFGEQRIRGEWFDLGDRPVRAVMEALISHNRECPACFPRDIRGEILDIRDAQRLDREIARLLHKWRHSL